VIQLHDVTKTYRSLIPPKPVVALAGMTLSFGAGEVVGIAGPNGAGKSNMLSIVLGFLSPTSGSVDIDGMKPRRFVERHGMAYVPELVAIPPWWRVTGALNRFAVLSGLPKAERAHRVEEAIESMGLEEHLGKSVKQLSKGNRQRLGIAQALLSDASVVIFDEPTHGLDPVWSDRFRDLVGTLRRPDRAIVIASHNLNELERVADRVAILDHGRLTRVTDLQAESQTRETRHYLLVLATDIEAVPEIFPGATRAPATDQGVAWTVDGELDFLNRGLRTLLEGGASVRFFAPRRSRLESEFHEAVGK